MTAESESETDRTPNRTPKGLPDHCYALDEAGALIVVQRDGSVTQFGVSLSQKTVDSMNQGEGIFRAQAAAMLATVSVVRSGPQRATIRPSLPARMSL